VQWADRCGDNRVTQEISYWHRSQQEYHIDKCPWTKSGTEIHEKQKQKNDQDHIYSTDSQGYALMLSGSPV
jgi:hypothetical protein